MRARASFQLFLLSCVLFSVACEDFPSDEVKALTKFKEAIYKDPLRVLSNWNATNSDPCSWKGIYCSKAGDHVIKINISGTSLKGNLAPELHLISNLQELILHGNLLLGKLPKEIGLLRNLKVLDLGANRLTGPIPSEISNLSNISKIILQSNGLTGSLPPGLGNLEYLEELRLDRNRLHGVLPASNITGSTSGGKGMDIHGGYISVFCHSSHLKVVDFSFNFFVGSIPKCLSYLPSSSFQGNCLQVKAIEQRSAVRCGSTPHGKNHTIVNTTPHPLADNPSLRQPSSKPTWLLALEVGTGIAVGTLFIVALLTTFQKLKTKASIIIPWKMSGSQNEDHMPIFVETEMLKDVVRYSRQQLEVACEDFSNIIGSSPDSFIYKGTMRSGPEIAVVSMCVKEDYWSAHLELYFQDEVAELSRINHKNISKLLGYCRESSPFTRMLVFEYASNGTLYEHLHYGDGYQLSWMRRMNIVIGIAKGLKYLHTNLTPPFTICELNSNSVYLTEDFSPKLVDFESWKAILSRSERSLGAMSSEDAVSVFPSSMEKRHIDIQGNIYSFGLLLLEIISGKPPYCKHKGSLVDWANEFLEVPEAMAYVVDPELKHFRYEDLNIICEVIKLCIQPSWISRTSMSELCTLLEGNIDTCMSVELRASLAWAELSALS